MPQRSSFSTRSWPSTDSILTSRRRLAGKQGKDPTRWRSSKLGLSCWNQAASQCCAPSRHSCGRSNHRCPHLPYTSGRPLPVGLRAHTLHGDDDGTPTRGSRAITYSERLSSLVPKLRNQFFHGHCPSAFLGGRRFRYFAGSDQFGQVCLEFFDVELRRGRNTNLATFGDAQLVRDTSGRLELKGGSEEDRQQARLWARMFLTRASHQRPPVVSES
jgi:hypothetical protein